MAQDLKLAGSIIEPDGAKPGQFWRDVVLGDVLKILEISNYVSDPTLPPILYARCACYPRGEGYLGIQEMKASHFKEERFQRVELGRIKQFWWSKVKFRKP